MATTPAKPTTLAEVKRELATEKKVVAKLAESMHELQLALEDRHWRRLVAGNVYEANGLDLSTIKHVSEDLRTWVAGGLLKRIAEVRGNTIYGDGIGFKNFARAQAPFGSPNNVAKLFSVSALQEINRAHCTDGTIVFLVHKRTKEIVRYFINEMEDPYLDGMDPERIWYVRRQWTAVTPLHPEGETLERYYVTDTCPPAQANKTRVKVAGDQYIKIDRDYTAVVWDVNKQGGWPLGLPDLLAALQWAERYTGYLKNQDKFAEALASIAWEYSASNTNAATKMVASLATEQVAGTAVHGDNMELNPMTGNSNVSFDNGAPLAAQAAAAGEITVDSLLAKSQSAAAQTLDPDVKKMAGARRQSATSFFKRIGKLLGAPNLEVIWPDLETESPFREAQMIISAFTQTGAFGVEEIRGPLAQRIRVPLAEGSTAPAGVLQPNSKSALEIAAKVAADNAAPAGAVDGKQGVSTKVGKLSDVDNNEARDRGEDPGS